MKTGLLFAGQGAQYPGMGKDLYDSFSGAREVFDLAGEEIKNWCFQGSKEELMQTHITQPCVYTMDMAALAAFCAELGLDLSKPEGSGKFGAKGLEILGVAGFSLGEYAALTAAGTIKDFSTAISIIRKRGEYMAEAGRDEEGNQRGGMCAVAGERDKVLELIAGIKGEGILEAVNFNTKTQTVVAGDNASLARLKEAGREVRLKVIPLSVSTAFHSEMMRPASEKLADFLANIEIFPPSLRVYSNITARDIMEGRPAAIAEGASLCRTGTPEGSSAMSEGLSVTLGDLAGTGAEGMSEAEQISRWLKEKMALQVMRPVYWQETLENMAADGVELFIEFGPGHTLSGFVKKTLPGATVYNVENAETLNAVLEAIGQKG